MLNLRYVSMWKVVAPYSGIEDDIHAIWWLKRLVPFLVVDAAMWYLVWSAWHSVLTMALLLLGVLAEYVISRLTLFAKVEKVARDVRSHARTFCRKHSHELSVPTYVNVVNMSSHVRIGIGVFAGVLPFTFYQSAKAFGKVLHSHYTDTHHKRSTPWQDRECNIYLGGLPTFVNAYLSTEMDSTLEQWTYFLFKRELQHAKQLQYVPKAHKRVNTEETRSYNYGELDEASIEMYQVVMHGLHTFFTPRQRDIIGKQGLLELDADLQSVYYLSKQYTAKEILSVWKELRSSRLTRHSPFALSAYVAKRVFVANVIHAESYTHFLAEVIGPIIHTEQCGRFLKAVEAEEFALAQEIMNQV